MSELQALAQFVKDFGWLGVTILIAAAFLFGIIHGDKEFQREVARGDRGFQMAEDATKQFERSLDVIERMQDRRRASDEVHKARG